MVNKYHVKIKIHAYLFSPFFWGEGKKRSKRHGNTLLSGGGEQVGGHVPLAPARKHGDDHLPLALFSRRDLDKHPLIFQENSSRTREMTTDAGRAFLLGGVSRCSAEPSSRPPGWLRKRCRRAGPPPWPASGRPPSPPRWSP